MDIEVGDKFVNTHLLHEMADFYNANGKYTFIKKILFLIDNFVNVKNIEEVMDMKLHVL